MRWPKAAMAELRLEAHIADAWAAERTVLMDGDAFEQARGCGWRGCVGLGARGPPGQACSSSLPPAA